MKNENYKPEIIKLKIKYKDDQRNMIIALAESGYKVWVETQNGNMCIDFSICFEKP